MGSFCLGTIDGYKLNWIAWNASLNLPTNQWSFDWSRKFRNFSKSDHWGLVKSRCCNENKCLANFVWSLPVHNEKVFASFLSVWLKDLYFLFIAVSLTYYFCQNAEHLVSIAQPQINPLLLSTNTVSFWNLLPKTNRDSHTKSPVWFRIRCSCYKYLSRWKSDDLLLKMVDITQKVLSLSFKNIMQGSQVRQLSFFVLVGKVTLTNRWQHLLGHVYRMG